MRSRLLESGTLMVSDVGVRSLLCSFRSGLIRAPGRLAAIAILSATGTWSRPSGFYHMRKLLSPHLQLIEARRNESFSLKDPNLV